MTEPEARQAAQREAVEKVRADIDEILAEKRSGIVLFALRYEGGKKGEKGEGRERGGSGIKCGSLGSLYGIECETVAALLAYLHIELDDYEAELAAQWGKTPTQVMNRVYDLKLELRAQRTVLHASDGESGESEGDAP